MKRSSFIRSFIGVICLTNLSACGNRGKSDDDSPARGKIEGAFYTASSESGVPVRLMMAVGYLESGLQSTRSSATYVASADNRLGSQQTIDFGDSAFGLSLEELGVDKDSNSAALETQIRAYGKYLKTQLKGKSLPANAVTPEEKMRWISQLAAIHHGGDDQHRNLWAIFAQEMISTLNKGFEVRDSDSGEILKLEKETPEINRDQLPQNLKQDLALDTYHADIRPAYLFSLTSSQETTAINHPKRVEVIHCPFSLTVCIDLQQHHRDGRARMMAHYIIPRDDSSGPGVLQMARQDESVLLTDTNGTLQTVSDRIVVMMTGNSGRYVDGVRTFANPQWLTDYQLRLLGAVVTEVCSVLERTEKVNKPECLTPGGDNGVLFRNQPASNYRWGDISDFDESIFYPYITNGSGSFSATIETSDGRTIYDAGTQFTLTVKFQAAARRVEVERLVRCGNDARKMIWEPNGYPAVKNVTSKSFDMTWYDSGPNANGDQFFRAKVFGEGSKFLGWATQQIQLRNIQKDATNDGASKYCLANK